MKPDSNISSRAVRISHPLRRFTALAPRCGVSLLLLGAACSSSDEFPAADPPAASGVEQSPDPSSDPAPAAPAAGQTTANTESIASGPTALDGAGATAPGATAPGGDAGAPSPSPEDGAPAGSDAGAPPSPTDPSLDENLAFILQDGFQTTWFVNECRSIAADGAIIEAAENGGALPVGGGYILECRLEQFPSRATTSVLSTLDEPWCALGELESYGPGGDERLTINVVTPPDVAPAILIATRDGERIDIVQAAAFGALVWPLWIEASYDVNEVAPAEPGKVCDETFGL